MRSPFHVLDIAGQVYPDLYDLRNLDMFSGWERYDVRDLAYLFNWLGLHDAVGSA